MAAARPCVRVRVRVGVRARACVLGCRLCRRSSECIAEECTESLPAPQFKDPSLWTNSIGATKKTTAMKFQTRLRPPGRIMPFMSVQEKELTKSIRGNIIWDISKEEWEKREREREGGYIV